MMPRQQDGRIVERVRPEGEARQCAVVAIVATWRQKRQDRAMKLVILMEPCEPNANDAVVAAAGRAF